MGQSWSDNNWAVAGVLGVTLMTAIGFLIGPISDYSASVDAPNQQEQIETDLPESYYQETPYQLGPQQQLQLTFQNDVVFVNAFYSNEEQREQMSFLEEFSSDYNERVYTSLANETSTAPMVSQYGLTEDDLPMVVVVGSAGESAQDAIRQIQGDQITEENVNTAVCDVFRNWNDLASKCV